MSQLLSALLSGLVAFVIVLVVLQVISPWFLIIAAFHFVCAVAIQHDLL